MVAAPAYAGVGNYGPVDPSHGFPAWYDDGAGHKLQPCLDGPPLCLSGLPDPTQPASVGATPQQSNFPEEAFYWSAEATIPTSGGQEARLTLAQEAAFAGGVPANGEQITFGRVRIRASGLVAGARSKVTYPYGTRTFVADSGTRNINFTRDIGCGVPCDLSATGGSEIGTPFLQWDPEVAPAAPAGYLGDPTIAHVITGSPTGDNLFRIERLAANGTVLGLVGETRLFTLEGKIATGPDPSPGTPPQLSDNGVGKFGTTDHAYRRSDAIRVASGACGAVIEGQQPANERRKHAACHAGVRGRAGCGGERRPTVRRPGGEVRVAAPLADRAEPPARCLGRRAGAVRIAPAGVPARSCVRLRVSGR